MLDKLNDRLEVVGKALFQRFERLGLGWKIIVVVLLMGLVFFLEWPRL